MENDKTTTIPKELCKLQSIASKDEFRANLTGVYFNGTEAVATNGHMMIVKKTSHIDLLSDEALPHNRIVKLPAKPDKNKFKKIWVDNKGINSITPKDSVEFIDMPFVDYQEVIKGVGEKVAMTVTLDADYLLALAKALNDGSKRNLVTLEIESADKAVKLTGSDSYAYGILMPARMA